MDKGCIYPSSIMQFSIGSPNKKTFSIEPPFLLHHLVNPFFKIAALKIISSIWDY